MELVVLKDGLLIFKVFGLAYFLVLHGSAGLSPDGGETPVPESQRTSAISPIMAETPQKVFLQPPQSSPPISSALSPGRVNDPIVPALPPSIDFSPPVNASDNSTVLAPSAPPGNPKHSDPIPETPAPFPLPSTNSPNNSYISPGLSPAGSLSPPSPAPFPLPSTNSPNNSSISPGLPPAGSLSPPSPDAASTIPPALPPVNSVVPELSPPRSPVPKALPPRMPPIALPENPLHIQPPLPVAKPPPILSGPAVSPVPSQERVGLPPQATAPPQHEIIRNESTTNGSHINAPAPEAVIVPSVNLPPPPSKSPMGPTSSTSEPPPTSVVWHRYEKNNRSSPSPQLYTGSPPTSHEQDPKINKSFHGPPPLKPVSSIPPYVSASPPSTRQYYSPPPSPSLVPPVSFISPKTSPSGSSPRIPKFRQPSFQALPPPPPNEGCTSFTCTDPLTIGPPGTPCVCVLPMQVALRLSVALYTFFPLVSELATEIANGVFFKPSQVRIMGANVADVDSEKTTVLLDLVPLRESFDNATSYLIFRRFWHKELVINDSLFGNYEVLYVRYPGLPPSPPVGVDFENSDPYYGHGNGAAVKPLGVDVPRTTRRGGPSKSVIAIIILSSSLAVIFGSVIAWFLVFRRRDHLSEPESTPPVNLPSSAKSAGMGISAFGSPHSSASMSLPSSIAIFTGSAKTFTSIEMERATENFSESRIIGEGGFGLVYKGMLDDEKPVAVKVLKRADQQGSREFLAEVEMLSRLHHRNLVKLIGICIEERARCLVYELIPNGSVESHLHGIHKESSPLDWNSRLKIALGAARGLAYLHEDSSPRVIHRDFKSSNILLEHDFTPKVSDFGLARTALEEENKHISTRVMGTFGYVAPEYAMTGHLLVKSDVYSYGVVLLELLTGRKPVDMSQPSGQENLVSWARPLLTSEEGLESIIDSSLGPGFPYDSISKVAAIASMCVQPEVSHRPFMGEVVQALKLVCNECDETTELGSTGFSHEDVVALDVDATISGYLHHPIRSRSQTSGYDSEVDVERGHSGSYLLDSSVRYTRQDSGSIERYSSSSGPLRTGKTKRLWQKVSLLSGGSFSDHSLMFNSWRRSL